MTQERYILQLPYPVDHAFRTSGTLESWQENVARYAVKNSRLVLGICTGLAAPLLYPTDAESGGFHLRGGSSTGKTTVLLVAGSVWGGGGVRGFLRSWRATSNGMEGICAVHCDTLLCLDEMGEVDGHQAAQIAYMLANGVGKARAGRGGEARKAAEWRLLFLSSGELGLADKIAEDGRGRRIAAGQEVRIVDIAADAGAGMGVFENLHGFANGDEFAQYLRTATRQHYGYPNRPFIDNLIRDFDTVAPTVKEYILKFLEEECPTGADGQVSRVGARFGLAAAAGEMAVSMGILPWPEGEASNALARCYRDWIAARGGAGSGEDRAAVATVRRFIEMHGSSRFEGLGELAPQTLGGTTIEQRVQNRVGFRRRNNTGGIEYLILPEAWKSEVCAGLDPSAVAKVLADRNLIARNPEGKYQLRSRLPGFDSPVRHYLVTAEILGGSEHASPRQEAA